MQYNQAAKLSQLKTGCFATALQMIAIAGTPAVEFLPGH
jgi:hypothetical protein